MNYRDFFKNHKATPKDILRLLPEGVDPDEFKKGISTEKEHTDDEFTAAKIAGDHLKEDPKYYTKLTQAGLEEEEQDEHCGACKDDMGRDGDEYDDNGGLPKVGGALAIPHLGDPIRMSKIIQVGTPFGAGSASGEQSGMSACGSGKGVTKDTGGVKADSPGDKEPITAGGKKVDSSIATKSVGGAVSPGDGQKQGGPNSQGTIAATPKMNEHKEKVRKIVKEVLKEIRFDKASGKWVRIDEAKHKAGCTCAFCKNKGSFGKKKEKEDVDENTVDMKMGPSYKVVQPTLAKTAEMDFARTNQYDPEVTEMIDEEEIVKMNERYAALATMPRNLSEDELKEMNSLRNKLAYLQEQDPDEYDPQGYDTEDPEPPEAPHVEFDPDDMDECRDAAMKMGPSYRVVAPQQARCLDCDQAHRNQDTPTSTNEAGGQAVQHSSARTVKHGNLPQRGEQRWADDMDEGEKKDSKVVKAIKKGQKAKKTVPAKLKHEQPRHTSSGVHKRKT
jgi:hypothetical protein